MCELCLDSLHDHILHDITLHLGNKSMFGFKGPIFLPNRSIMQCACLEFYFF